MVSFDNPLWRNDNSTVNEEEEEAHVNDNSTVNEEEEEAHV